jgi:hypothetical protein
MKKKTKIFDNIKFLSKKKPIGGGFFEKDEFSLIFIFISHLFLNKKKFLSNYDQREEEENYHHVKRHIWKQVLKFSRKRSSNFSKILELILMGKKFNMRKNLTKYLLIFTTRKNLLNFWWSLIIILEKDTSFKLFTLDYLFLFGIKKTGFINYFLNEYLKFKINMMEELSVSLKNNNSPILSYSFKKKLSGKILPVICCNFKKLKLFNSFVTCLNILGKNVWLYSISITPLKEIINIIKSRFRDFNLDYKLLVGIFFSDFPIIKSFCLFPVIREVQSYYSNFLVAVLIYSKFKKNKLKVEAKLFPSTLNVRSRTFLKINSVEFYLY